MTTWADGTSANRTAAALEALTPEGFDPTEVDSAIQAWDDPLGIGFASTHVPGSGYTQGTWPTANRAMFHRCVSGGVVSVLRGLSVVVSGNIDIAIYANSGSGRNAVPGTKLWSTGSIACPTNATGGWSIAVSPSITVKARKHWFAMSCDNTTASFMLVNSVNQFFATHGWAYFTSSFPLPDPAPTLGTSGTTGVSRHPFLVGGSS